MRFSENASSFNMYDLGLSYISLLKWTLHSWNTTDICLYQNNVKVTNKLNFFFHLNGLVNDLIKEAVKKDVALCQFNGYSIQFSFLGPLRFISMYLFIFVGINFMLFVLYQVCSDITMPVKRK